MYIKGIVLDGFKSYASRTEISGFDSEFNAITGLNGSGKSNILDAICFVLGISNLSQAHTRQQQVWRGRGRRVGMRSCARRGSSVSRIGAAGLDGAARRFCMAARARP